MEIQRGPREAVCFQAPPNRESAWHVYGAHHHPSSSLSEKKSCTYPPSRGKSYAQNLQGAELYLAHKCSCSQPRKWCPREKGLRPSAIYAAETELRNFLISLFYPVQVLTRSWKHSSSYLATLHILYPMAQNTLCWVLTSVIELCVPRGLGQISQRRCTANSCITVGKKNLQTQEKG